MRWNMIKESCHAQCKAFFCKIDWTQLLLLLLCEGLDVVFDLRLSHHDHRLCRQDDHRDHQRVGQQSKKPTQHCLVRVCSFVGKRECVPEIIYCAQVPLH